MKFSLRYKNSFRSFKCSLIAFLWSSFNFALPLQDIDKLLQTDTSDYLSFREIKKQINKMVFPLPSARKAYVPDKELETLALQIRENNNAWIQMGNLYRTEKRGLLVLLCCCCCSDVILTVMVFWYLTYLRIGMCLLSQGIRYQPMLVPNSENWHPNQFYANLEKSKPLFILKSSKSMLFGRHISSTQNALGTPCDW